MCEPASVQLFKIAASLRVSKFELDYLEGKRTKRADYIDTMYKNIVQVSTKMN